MDMPTHITANPLATGNDELEPYVLEECYGRRRTDHRASVLVMPTGSCEMAIRFPRCGADVVVRDSQGSSQGRRAARSPQPALGTWEGDADSDQRATQRHAPPSPAPAPAPAKRWGISSAVCLCSEHTYFMLLEAGASVLRTMTTIHRNVASVRVRV